MPILKNDWASLLQGEFEKPYYLELRAFLKKEYQSYPVYPDMYDIYNALHYTPYEKVKVVILGQDPYHGPGQAHGLSFSVQPDVPLPPSLQNIYKELQADLGIETPAHGCLTSWAQQGVLLLNTVLTVRQGQPQSHRGIGWETFTNRVIETLSDRSEPIVFILWGRHAQQKKAFINTERHDIIESPHPSPFSANRGFFGSRPFSRVNHYLQESGQEPIDWRID
ncbi:uracil-DNA glycosylase [Caldalkalibacillus salinus]|uniref:uracil-DNA glycosylase n=1 Tax=Caldalkalibacillus salinus TaxID=2803787 RepID=UPI0019233458|nr:uracil-DNA glycosylase [Caldalkalibacillus salinus]